MKIPHRMFVSLLVLGLAAPLSADTLVLAGTLLSRAPLPGGSSEADLTTLSALAREVVYLDDGRLLGIRDVETEAGPGHALVHILGDGTVEDLGIVQPPADVFGAEDPLDLAVDSQGRLFWLSWVPTGWNPPSGYTRLVQLDPDDASTISNRTLDKNPWMLARAPSQLWALTFDGLELLHPDQGTFTLFQPVELLANDGDTDSTGTLWLFGEGVCSPPCFFFYRFDPATGQTTALTTENLNPAFTVFSDLAIERSCEGSSTALCLQGGRFRAELEWRDAAGAVGPGRLTQARSADSGVFWLFDPANWEVNVKVLNGCAQNDHFWVFASGSTNVGLTLTVTDLEGEVVQTYGNPLGTTMKTVTDTAAFPCEGPGFWGAP